MEDGLPLMTPDLQRSAVSPIDSSQRLFRRSMSYSLPLVALALVATNVAFASGPAQNAAATQAVATPQVANPQAAPPAAQEPVLMQAMETELHRAIADLGSSAAPAASTREKATEKKPYFVSYSVADAESVTISAQYGAITNSTANHGRTADVQVRLGSPAQDNTHDAHRASALTTMSLPLTDDRAAIERTLWYATDRGYGKALDALEKVKTEQQVRAREEDVSADFSEEQPEMEILPKESPLSIDRAAWESRVREISGVFRSYPNIFYDAVVMEATHETDYFVSSEGSQVAAPNHVARLVVVARTRASDGMDMFRDETFEADSAGHLPDQAEVLAKTAALAKGLNDLRTAPITEPYNGPAILSGRAAAVFFHEGLGHRLEGQRQRGDEEGETFTKLLGKPILPNFLSVADDPTLAQFQGTWLSGHYDFDDEGQAARRVGLIHDGVLETFLMSRLPIASVAQSNGHGRAESGHMPAGRQGNLIVTSSKSVPESALPTMPLATAKKQGKPYGLYFEDISSGFAVTNRGRPQAFSVTPLVVYRVYVDGRPDELVRGVSIVGTPQTALASIIATGEKQDIFNGICGAESGSIPVSAV